MEDLRIEERLNGKINLSLNSFEKVNLLKENLMCELKDIFTRVSFLNLPPYIIQESEQELYEVHIINKFHESCKIVNKKESKYLDYIFSKNTLFFLEDGFAVDFKDLDSEPILVVFGSVQDEEFYQKASDVYFLDTTTHLNNFYTSFYSCEYKVNNNLKCIDIENLYISNDLTFSIYNLGYYDKVKFKIDNLYLDCEISSLNFECKFDIDTIHFINHPLLNFSFKGINVQNIDIPEGVEVLLFHDIYNVYTSEVTLPSTLKYIGDGCFRNSHIKKIDMSKMTNFGLGMLAFSGCNIQEIDLLDCAYIGPSCFTHSKIKHLDLNLYSKIAISAFSDMTNLLSVDYYKLDSGINFKSFDIDKYKQYEYEPDYEESMFEKASIKYGYDVSHFFSSYTGDSYSFPIDIFLNDYFLSEINIPINCLILEHGSIKGCKYGLKINGYKEIKVYDMNYTLLSISDMDIVYLIEKYYNNCYKSIEDCLDMSYAICEVYYNLEELVDIYDEDYKTKFSKSRKKRVYRAFDENFYNYLDEDGYPCVEFHEYDCIYGAIEAITSSILEIFPEYFDTFYTSNSGFMLGYNYHLLGNGYRKKLIAEIPALINAVIDNILFWGSKKNEEFKIYNKIIDDRKLHTFNYFRMQ